MANNPGCLLFVGDETCCSPPPLNPEIHHRSYRAAGSGDISTTDWVTYPNTRVCSGNFTGWIPNGGWIASNVGTAQSDAVTQANGTLSGTPCSSEANWEEGLQTVAVNVKDTRTGAAQCARVQLLPHAALVTEWTWTGNVVELGQGNGRVPFAIGDDGSFAGASGMVVHQMTGVFVPMSAGQSLSSVHTVNDIVVRMRYSNQLNMLDSTWAGSYVTKRYDSFAGCVLQGGSYLHNTNCTTGSMPAPDEDIELWYGSAASVEAAFQDVIDGGTASLMTRDYNSTPAIAVSTVNSHTSTAWATHALQSGHTYSCLIMATATKCKATIDTQTAIAATEPTSDLVQEYRVMTNNCVQSFIDLDFRDSVPSTVQLVTVPGG